MKAATRLLDAGDLSILATNAVAERAGVSIGTLYPHFKDKQAILDALALRELDGREGLRLRFAQRGAAAGA